MTKSRFKQKGPRPGRFLAYVLAGALVLGVGGMAAEHGGPTLASSLVAAKANGSKPAPPAPHPNKTQTNSGVQSNSSGTANPPPGATNCKTHPNGDEQCTGPGGGSTPTPVYGSNGSANSCPGTPTSGKTQDQVKCQNPGHKSNPNQCYWVKYQYKAKDGTSKTEYKIWNDNDTNGKGQPKNHDQKNEKCEASGVEPS